MPFDCLRNQTENVCLFTKISRENVSCKLSGRRPVKCFWFFGTEMSRCMWNIKRGKQRASEDSGYFIIGERANRSAPGTGHVPIPGVAKMVPAR